MESHKNSLPDACTVEALGISGPYCFYRDAEGRIRRLAVDDHDRWVILSLFQGDEPYLRMIWPLKNSTGVIVAFDDAAAAGALMATASEKGITSSRALGLEVENGR